MSDEVIRSGRLEVELPNGSDGDSLVHLRLPQEGRSLLFDAGDPSRLAFRDVLRVDQLFVSHCHVDHFIGFDALVRARVCRADRMTCHGPPGFLERVQSRLGGYDWNLTDGNRFELIAREVRDREVLVARFESGAAFRREELPVETTTDAVFDDGEFEVRSAALDHRIISQGWSLRWRDRLRVDAEALSAQGLRPGPWLAELKRRLHAGENESSPLDLPDGSTIALGLARDRLLAIEPGERFAYVTDTLFAEHTVSRIVDLADRADVFACEAPFLESESEKATASHHLTARQAGRLAREAGVKLLLLFHVSDRYQGDFRLHREEASAAAGSGVEVRTVARP